MAWERFDGAVETFVVVRMRREPERVQRGERDARIRGVGDRPAPELDRVASPPAVVVLDLKDDSRLETRAT
jgi:hypothetical protein